MHLSSTSKKKQFYQGSKLKNSKVNNLIVEDTFPFEVNQQQCVTPQTKQYIHQLERIYLERYNILIKNREIYGNIIDNISTELDQQGITHQQLIDLFKNSPYIRPNNLQGPQ